MTLLGDACHAMLPFWAQGAAQAIEDGAVLASCLAEIGRSGIPKALRLYESLRLPRTSRIQAASAENKTRFHLPDGPQQRARDAQLGDASADWFLNGIAWVYGHDAEAMEGLSGPQPALKEMRMWRNWQTRMIQVHVPAIGVEVQVLSSAPI